MSLVVLLVVVVLAVAVARLVLGTRSAPAPAALPSPELRATARTTRRWRLAGVTAGLVVGVVTAYQGALGRGLLLAAPLFALCVLAGVLAGELRVGAPAGSERRAALEVRRVRDYVPRALGSAVLAAGGLLGVVLVLTTAAGSPDDLGRAGRSLERRCSAVMTQGAGPWPGSFYALPLAVVVLCGVLAAGLVLLRVVRRPRQSADLDVDDALRRSAAGAATAAAGLLIAVPLAGVSAVAGGALVGIPCRPGAWTLAAIALAALAAASLALAAWCAATLIAPGSLQAPAAAAADR
ncbi:MAG: hypothetical protein ACXVX0_03860 [Blastococcus sp.]